MMGERLTLNDTAREHLQGGDAESVVWKNLGGLKVTQGDSL